MKKYKTFQVGQAMCRQKHLECAIVVRMFKTFNLKSAIKSIGLEKPNGLSITALLQNLMLFRLYGESIFRSLVFGISPDSFGKDRYYRLYKNEQKDWRKLMYAASLSFHHVVGDKTTTLHHL